MGNISKNLDQEMSLKKKVHVAEEEGGKHKLDLETDLDTVASVTSNDPRLTFDPIT